MYNAQHLPGTKHTFRQHSFLAKFDRFVEYNVISLCIYMHNDQNWVTGIHLTPHMSHFFWEHSNSHFEMWRMFLTTATLLCAGMQEAIPSVPFPNTCMHAILSITPSLLFQAGFYWPSSLSTSKANILASHMMERVNSSVVAVFLLMWYPLASPTLS